jgi:hypothetical protein
MDLNYKQALSLDGFFHDYGFSSIPPGEVPTSKLEGTQKE